MGVERVAARWKTVARGGGAIAERAADEFVLERIAAGGVEKDCGIGEHHAAEASKIDPAFADGGLRDVGEEILEIAVAGAGDDERRGIFVLVRG